MVRADLPTPVTLVEVRDCRSRGGKSESQEVVLAWDDQVAEVLCDNRRSCGHRLRHAAQSRCKEGAKKCDGESREHTHDLRPLSHPTSHLGAHGDDACR